MSCNVAKGTTSESEVESEKTTFSPRSRRMSDHAERPAGNLLVGRWKIVPGECLIIDTDSEDPPVKVSPRAMDVLTYLAAHGEQVVSSDELLDELWDGSFVSSNAAQKCIAELRQAFGDDSSQPRIIQTVPKRGYKLLVPAEHDPNAELQGDLAVPPPVAQGRRWAAVALGLVLLVALTGAISVFQRSEATAADTLVDIEEDSCDDPCAPSPTSIAVLRFAQTDTATDEDSLVEGLSELILGGLSSITHLEVASQSDSFRESTLESTTREIGARLGVEHILEGKMAVGEGRLSLRVALVNVDSGLQLYGERFDRDIDDLFAVQEEISSKILDALEIHLDDVERERMLHTGTKNVFAYLEQRQSYFDIHTGTIESLGSAADHARRAIELDPDYEQAYECLLVAYRDLITFLPAEKREVVRREVAEILADVRELFPESEYSQGDALLAATLADDRLGVVVQLTNWIRADPGRVDDETRLWAIARLGLMLDQARMFEEGEPFRRAASDGLRRLGAVDWPPYEPGIINTLYREGLEASILRRKEALAGHPEDIATLTGLVGDLGQAGRHLEAEQVLERLSSVDKEGLWAHSAGAELRVWKNELRPGTAAWDEFDAHPLTSNVVRGTVAFMTGAVELGVPYWQALDSTEDGVVRSGLWYLEFRFPDSVRSDPAYLALLEELNAGEGWRSYLAGKVEEVSPYIGIEPSETSAYQ